MSEIGKKLQKWVLYHEIDAPTDFWLSWDPTDSEDMRLLQKYRKKWICSLSPKQHSQEPHQSLGLYEHPHRTEQTCRPQV